MKIVSVVLLLVGLVLCPGYVVYATMFSGTEVGEFQFVDRATSSISFGVFHTTSIGNDQANKEGGIQLSPDMNPIRFIVNASYMRNFSKVRSFGRRSDFELSFYDSSDLLWTEPFQIAESSSDSSTQNATAANNKSVSQAIKLFTVEKDATYKLRLNQLSHQELSVETLSVQVRANVIEVDTKIWATGVGLILLSALGFYFVSKQSST